MIATNSTWAANATVHAEGGRGRGSRPYVGLRPFSGDEYGLFFGRDREALDVCTLWEATGLTILFGASGVGKTSLLHAGVVPRIAADRADVLPIVRMSPQVSVMPSTDGNRYVLALLAGWTQEKPESPSARLTVSEFLWRRPRRFDRYGDPMPVLAAIDQAEELFSGPVHWGEEREECLRQLAQAVTEHAGLHLLLSLREECLAAVLPYERPLGHGSRTRIHLKPFTRQAALAAITGPLEGTGRCFGSGAAEVLVDDLRAVTYINDERRQTRLVVDTIEPVQLQVVCSALWEALPADVHEITEDHVRAYADIDRFLVGFCRRVLKEVASEHDVSEDELRHWLRSRLVTEHGTRNVVYEGLQETAGMPNSVARALEDRHVLRTEHRMGVRWYELQHDRLIAAIREPQPPSLSVDQARQALEEGRWEAARRLADDALRGSGVENAWIRAEVQAILGEVDAALGETGEARRRFVEAAEIFAMLRQFDKVAQVLTAEGRLWLAQDEYAKAVDTLKTALSWAGDEVSTQLELGRALWRSGQPQAALSCLNGAVERAARPPAEALALRGEVLIDLDRAQDALRDLSRVSLPRRPETLAARALAFAMTGRHDVAEMDVLDAVESAASESTGPGTGEWADTRSGRRVALVRAARTYALLGNPATAARLAARALEGGGPGGLPAHLRRQADGLRTATA